MYFEQRKYQTIDIFLSLTDLIKNCAIWTAANIVTPEIPILCSYIQTANTNIAEYHEYRKILLNIMNIVKLSNLRSRFG